MSAATEREPFDPLLQLAGLGLTGYEAKTYLALVRRDSSTASEVARLAGVPRQRIYDVLGDLIENGLASRRPGRVAKYVAAPPESALERLLARRREQLAASEQTAAALLGLLRPAYEAGRRRTDPLDYIQVLRGRQAIRDRFDELQGGVARELLALAKLPQAVPITDGRGSIDLARRRLVRRVYERSILDRPEAAEWIRRLTEAGQQTRFVPELPLDLAIIDRAIVLFAIEDPVADGPRLTTVVVDHRALARVLMLAFEAIWTGGLAFDQARDAIDEDAMR